MQIVTGKPLLPSENLCRRALHRHGNLFVCFFLFSFQIIFLDTVMPKRMPPYYEVESKGMKGFRGKALRRLNGS